MQKTICVDFDGVIADYSKGFQGVDVFGEPLHGAGSSMGALKEAGWRVIIFTTRPDTPALRDYLRENGIPYDYINENPDQPEGASSKIIADLYLDDRAMRFHGWADFRYALDAMVKEKVLESAESGDWQALKAIFESGNPNNDWGEYDGGIVLADNAAEAARITAVKAIRQVNTFQNLAEWFASAFDVGPAGAYSGLSDAARNIDAIFAFARKWKAWQSVYENQTADVEDRIDAATAMNKVATVYPHPIAKGITMSTDAFQRITGVNIHSVQPPVDSAQYADHKLEEYRGKAKQLMAVLGIDFEASRTRIKDLSAEIEAARLKLSEQVVPISEAWQARHDAALKETEFDAKTAEYERVKREYAVRRAEWDKERPKDLPYYSSTEDDRRVQRELYQEWSNKMQDIWDECNAALDQILKDRNAAYVKATEMAGDLGEETRFFTEPFNALQRSKLDEIAAEQGKVQALKDHVINSSPVSQEDADQWFDSMVLVSKNMQTNLKKRGYDMVSLKQHMTEFYRMTGGRLSRISFEPKGGGRAAAQSDTGVVYVAGTFKKPTFFHEMAHLLEDDQRTKVVAHRFLDQRTGRADGKVQVQKLSKLTGIRAYGANEVAYPDSFIDPYVGKYYRHGTTEVFSMGMQYFSSPEHMAQLWEKDPDHFNFMLGYMITPPRLDKDKVEAQQQAMTGEKDAAQASEEFLKALDKKIAKAGDFWTKEGFEINPSYRGKWFARWEVEEGRYRQTWNVKGEKNIKRALWIHIAAGKPGFGPYELRELTGTIFGQNKVVIPPSVSKDEAIKGAL